jgi:hypothetical protein
MFATFAAWLLVTVWAQPELEEALDKRLKTQVQISSAK